MPVYLFTFHAYRSWMPDHPRGYVKLKRVLDADHQAAARYEQRARQDRVMFDATTLDLAVKAARESCACQGCRLHAMATDSTHVHILVSWRGDQSWHTIRQKLKEAMTRRFNQSVGRRQWFSAKGSRRRVLDRSHFRHLVDVYLPKHRGPMWRE